MPTLKKIYPTELNAEFSMTQTSLKKLVLALDTCRLHGEDKKANAYVMEDFYPFIVNLLEEMENLQG